VRIVPNFRYRALTQNGEVVNGTLSAPTAAEVARRIEYLRETISAFSAGQVRRR
jgi:type II secretory pathway component PulF